VDECKPLIVGSLQEFVFGPLIPAGRTNSSLTQNSLFAQMRSSITATHRGRVSPAPPREAGGKIIGGAAGAAGGRGLHSSTSQLNLSHV